MAGTNLLSNALGSGGPGGGGSLTLRDPPDIFTGATLAAARIARDAYFSAGANAAALAQFQASQVLAIVLDPTGDDNSVWQTYSPGQAGQAYDAARWLDRTSVVQSTVPGPPGPASTVVQQRTVFLRSADLQRLDDNYPTLVAAPGAGKFIEVSQVWLRKDGDDVPMPNRPESLVLGVSAGQQIQSADLSPVTYDHSGSLVVNPLSDFVTWSAARRVFFGRAVDQRDFARAYNGSTTSEAFFDTLYERVPGTQFVRGVPTKLWRTKATYADTAAFQAAINGDFFQVGSSRAVAPVDVRRYMTLSLIIPDAGATERPLASGGYSGAGGEDYTAIGSRYLDHILNLPDQGMISYSVGGHQLRANAPLMIGVDYQGDRQYIDSRYTAAAYDAWLQDMSDAVLALLVRYSVHDVTSPP